MASWFKDFLQDLRYSARMLFKAPGFTSVAALTLALGIGLVTVQFSLISAAFLKGLPFERGERIMALAPANSQGGFRRNLPLDTYLQWRGQQKSFSSLAACAVNDGRVSGDDLLARRYKSSAISANLFNLLGVRPLMGRSLLPEDEKPGAARAIWLSHRVWQVDFGGDPKIVGRAIRHNGELATILGVMPKGFAFPENEQIWTNLRLSPSGQPSDRDAGPVQVVGRLRDDATLASARAEFDVIAQRLAPSGTDVQEDFSRVYIGPFTETHTPGGRLVTMMLAMLGVVGGVLMLACVNVANLWAARAARHGHELAVRSALGATRWRLIRQMLVESTLLAALGAIGGLLLATWAVPLLNGQIAADPQRPFWIELDVDYRVLGATAAVTLIVGLVSGLLPALRSTRLHPGVILKDKTGGSTGLRPGFMNRALVTLQIGLACVLLLVTGVLVDGVRKMGRIDSPFDADGTLSARILFDKKAPTFADEAARRRFAEELLTRVRALPGVTAATISDRHPVDSGESCAVETPERSNGDPEKAEWMNMETVAAGYFRDLQIPVRQGREFNEADRTGGEPVAVINESFARMHWPGESPIGKRFRTVVSERYRTRSAWMTVVGLVPDLKMQSALSVRERRAGFYRPSTQNDLWRLFLLVRTAANPQGLIKPLKETVRTLAPDVPVDRIQTVTERCDELLSTPHAFSAMAFVFGISALLLAAVGIFAVTSFAVERRTREFGVRFALGARPADVIALVFRQSAWQLTIGLGGGFLAGGVLGQFLGRALTIPTAHFGLYLIIVATVVLSLAIALWLPARRAARVDPMTALRAE